MAGLKRKEDSIDELGSLRIKKKNQNTQKVIKYVEDALNPFQMSTDEKNLYGLTIGKAASDDVKNDLLKCSHNWEEVV